MSSAKVSNSALTRTVPPKSSNLQHYYSIAGYAQKISSFWLVCHHKILKFVIIMWKATWLTR